MLILCGREVVDFKYDVLQKLENTEVIEALINDETVLINKNLDMVVNLKQANVKLQDGYIEIYSTVEKKIIYLDNLGNLINSKEVLKENKLFAKKEKDKWGFIDEVGNFKIEPKYDFVTEFNEYGYAGIKVNNKWGVIDKAGNVLQEPKYEIEDGVLPNFIGKYYEFYLGYGEKFYKSE